MPCSITDLRTPYRLKQMIAPAASTSSGDLLARSRAFMFSHGMVTLAPGAHQNKGELIVPNEIARQDCLKTLACAEPAVRKSHCAVYKDDVNLSTRKKGTVLSVQMVMQR